MAVRVERGAERIEQRSLEALVPFARNARTHSDAFGGAGGADCREHPEVRLQQPGARGWRERHHRRAWTGAGSAQAGTGHGAGHRTGASHRGADTGLHIGRILCFEHAPLGTPTGLVGEIFRNLGPFLPENGARIATPLLATGNHSWPVEMVLPAMIWAAAEWMRRGLEINEFMIVEIDRARAQTCAKMFDAILEIEPDDAAADNVVAKAKAAVSVAARSFGRADADGPLDPEGFRALLLKEFGVRRKDAPTAPVKPPASTKKSAQKIIARKKSPRVQIDYGDAEQPYDVFVSYSTADREAAEALSIACFPSLPPDLD